MSRYAAARKSAAKTKNAPKTGLQRWLTADRLMIGGIAVFTVVVLIALLGNSLANQLPAADLSIPDESVRYPSQGQDHIDVGQSHPAYNSNPPTSGWHYVQPAPWGVYNEVLPDETLIHNLEHGGIWLSYQPDVSPEIIRQLEDITRRYPSHTIAAPRPQNDSPIAVAAWGRLLKMDTVDADQIYAFITRYRQNGPEDAP